MLEYLPLNFEVDVAGSVQEVWNAWTTEAGVTRFFAPACKIDLRPGGAYEMYFDLDAPEGEQGSEGCQFLAIDEYHMLSFTWNAPPEYPEIRSQRTHVCVRFEALSPDKTRVTLYHDGFGFGEEWEAVRHYFIRAWGKIVLYQLQIMFLFGQEQFKPPSQE